MLKKLFLIWVFIHLPKVVKLTCSPIDLTWPFNNETASWVESGRFQFINQVAVEEANGDWFAINDYKASEHAGTHMDAPYHFIKTGWKVGDIPLSHLVATGIKINLSQNASDQSLLLPKHLIAWEHKYGKIPKNAIILVYFNWAMHYHNKTAYFGGTTPSSYRFPGISKEAAEWIVTSRKIVGIGIDTASIDPGQSTDFPAHRTFLKHNIYHLENVKIPESLPVLMLFGASTPSCTTRLYPYVRRGTERRSQNKIYVFGFGEDHQKIFVHRKLYNISKASRRALQHWLEEKESLVISL